MSWQTQQTANHITNSRVSYSWSLSVKNASIRLEEMRRRRQKYSCPVHTFLFLESYVLPILVHVTKLVDAIEIVECTSGVAPPDRVPVLRLYSTPFRLQIVVIPISCLVYLV